jgi:type IV fimbrial biogenesis protein FimT
MVSQYRAATMANAMVSSLYRARGEAIHRNATVSVCKSSDGVKCSSTGGYERGWIVFHDVNGNAAIDANEAVIHVEQVPQSDVRLYGNNSVVNHISFTGLGVPKTTKGNFQAGTLTVCTPAFGEVAARLIVLSKPGNVRSAPSILTQCGPVPASEQ